MAPVPVAGYFEPTQVWSLHLALGQRESTVSLLVGSRQSMTLAAFHSWPLRWLFLRCSKMALTAPAVLFAQMVSGHWASADSKTLA